MAAIVVFKHILTEPLLHKIFVVNKRNTDTNNNK